jgi:molybdate transport repressor ModE-like protein
METNHIQFLRCVAEHGNISAAAREIGLTQPALTKIVSRVEDFAGARIFDRRSKGVTLTAFGQVYLQRMEVVERVLHSLSHEAHAFKSGLRGTVSIGIGEFWIGEIIPNVIARLAIGQPDIQVRIATGLRDDLMQQLLRGQIDFHLSRLTEDLPVELDSEALAVVNLFLTVRDEHPLTKLNRPVTLADLEPYHWILPPPTDPTTTHIEDMFRKQGMKQTPVMVESVNVNLTKNMLQSSDLVSVFSEVSINKPSPGFCRLETDWLNWPRSAGVISVKGRPLLPCSLLFLELLREESRIGSQFS